MSTRHLQCLCLVLAAAALPAAAETPAQRWYREANEAAVEHSFEMRRRMDEEDEENEARETIRRRLADVAARSRAREAERASTQGRLDALAAGLGWNPALAELRGYFLDSLVVRKADRPALPLSLKAVAKSGPLAGASVDLNSVRRHGNLVALALLAREQDGSARAYRVYASCAGKRPLGFARLAESARAGASDETLRDMAFTASFDYDWKDGTGQLFFLRSEDALAPVLRTACQEARHSRMLHMATGGAAAGQIAGRPYSHSLKVLDPAQVRVVDPKASQVGYVVYQVGATRWREGEFTASGGSHFAELVRASCRSGEQLFAARLHVDAQASIELLSTPMAMRSLPQRDAVALRLACAAAGLEQPPLAP